MDNIFNKSFEELMAQAGVAVTPVSEEIKAESVVTKPAVAEKKEEPQAMQTADFMVDVFGGDDTPMEDFNAFSEPVADTLAQSTETKVEEKTKVKEETKAPVKEEPKVEPKTKATKKTTKKAAKKTTEPTQSDVQTDHILDDETKEHIREQIKVVVQQIVFEEVRSAVVLAMDTLVKDLRG